MRVIQVGIGGFGKNWVGWLKQNPAVQVVGMVDLNTQALQEACLKHGYTPDICFQSLAKALANVSADAVVCATPPGSHRAVCVAAMRAGLDVLTEKPMAATPAHCRAILEAALSTGRLCAVSQNYRYRPAMWTLAEWVHKGRIGPIGQARIEFFKGVDFGGGFRHSMDYPLLIDMAIHHFDLIRFVTRLDPVSVQGQAWNPGWSNYQGDCSNTLVFEMSNGARVVYNGSWCAKGDFCDWNGNWHIEGSKGTLTCRLDEIAFHSAPDRYKVERVDQVALTEPPLSNQDWVLNDFIQAVRDRRRPGTDVFDNFLSIAMVFAAVKAVKTGRKVQVLNRADRDLLLRSRAAESQAEPESSS